jgi:2-oxoglutarate ferredoxin oxidoreductase subunit delta
LFELPPNHEVNAMKKVVILEERCKSCGLCVSVCPKKILTIAEEKINKQGYHPVECNSPEQCITCQMCVSICPDCAIELNKEEK